MYTPYVCFRGAPHTNDLDGRGGPGVKSKGSSPSLQILKGQQKVNMCVYTFMCVDVFIVWLVRIWFLPALSRASTVAS